MAIGACILLCLASCEPARRIATAAIRVGVPALEQNALLYVAEQAGLFSAQRLDVSVLDFDTGPAALAALADGSLHVAGTAEYPYVEAVMAGRDLRIIAVTDRFENDYLVVRRDRGIQRPADLRGRAVGVTLRSITEFYLARFLELNGIPAEEVSRVDVRPADFLSVMSSGNLDALVAWEPYVRRMTDAAPLTLEAWPIQNSQSVYGLLVCTGAWLEGHTREVTSLLRSLAAAQDRVARRPDEGQAVVASRLGYAEDYLASVWPRHQFALTLDFSLIAAMEDEARWLAATRFAGEVSVPDFTRLVHPEGLTSVRPRAVNLMR